jgi:hypothetical protein
MEVRGYVYPKYLNFSTVGGKHPSRLLVTVLFFRPLSSLFSPHEMSPQYHEVIFCLTHKGKFTYTLSSKSDFLSIIYSLLKKRLLIHLIFSPILDKFCKFIGMWAQAFFKRNGSMDNGVVLFTQSEPHLL